jgi:transposase
LLVLDDFFVLYVHKRSIFECKLCGHKDNADKNAAKNILRYEDWVVDQKKLLEQKALAQA